MGQAGARNTQPWHVYILTGDKLEELKNAAIAKCRTRVRDAIVKDPSIAPSFFLLARARRPGFRRARSSWDPRDPRRRSSTA